MANDAHQRADRDAERAAAQERDRDAAADQQRADRDAAAERSGQSQRDQADRNAADRA